MKVIMNQLLKKLSSDLQKKLIKKEMPSFEKPMLATLTKNYFDDKDWIYERKFDGERCLIYKDYDKVFLKSRNDKSLDATYPELIDAAKKFKVNQIILDGEVVAFKDGNTSFERLQKRLGLKSAKKAFETGVKVYIYLFDILYLDGYELVDLTLESRKKILKKIIKFKDPIRYTIHKNKKGVELFHSVCKKKWEGLIAKNRFSSYVHKRSLNWLKFKCVANQELVIGGYTDPQRSRIGFGSLLLGYYKDKKLIYAGKVGTGFNEDFLNNFLDKLKKIEIKKNPFEKKSIKESKNMHFVKPIYVAEIGFEEWTKDNKLRQPRFQGLRYDKAAEDVVLEKV